MPMFHYEATDRNGRDVVGSMDARDEAAVRERLARSGYTPVLIETAASAGKARGGGPSRSNGNSSAPSYNVATAPPPGGGYSSSPGGPRVGGPGQGAYGAGSSGQAPGGDVFVPAGRRPGVNVSTRALAQFYRQMANALKAGVPLTQALPAMGVQTSDRRLRDAIRAMEGSAARGRRMSEAMDEFPRVFSAGHVGLVRAGEGGGYLERAFEELANQTDAEWGVAAATRFNIILFIIRWVVVPWLFGYAWFMGHMGMWHTAEGGMDWSGFGRDAAQSCVATLVGALVLNLAVPLVWRGFRGTALGGALDSIVMGLPLLGARRLRLDRVKSLSSLSSAMNAGVPLTVAWQLASEAADGASFRRRMQEQNHAIRTGVPVPDVLASTRLYDSNTLQMAQSGEMAGNLPEMLSQAIFYQREEAKHMGQLIPWVIAIVVLFLVMGIMAYMVIVFGANVYGGEVENALKQTGP